MVESGITPQISFQAGRLSWLCIEVNRQKLIIRNQHLSHSSIDGTIEIEDVGVYNKMNECMLDMEMSIFKNEHKSYYSQQDIDILDEYRSVPNVGEITGQKKKCKYVEIDISKAYTAAFKKIQCVPVFTEFDQFKPYKGEAIMDYSLYIVKATKKDMFFQQAIQSLLWYIPQ
jgi:hypothetical protein